MFLLNGVIRFIIGPYDRRVSDGERFIITVREFKEATGLLQGIALKTSQALSFGFAAICTVLLFWFLSRTRAGKSMRAYSDNEELALRCLTNSVINLEEYQSIIERDDAIKQLKK